MLQSIDTCQNRVSADQYHLAISRAKFTASQGPMFFKFTADQLLVSEWIAGSCQVYLFETGQDCSEAGLKFKI